METNQQKKKIIAILTGIIILTATAVTLIHLNVIPWFGNGNINDSNTTTSDTSSNISETTTTTTNENNEDYKYPFEESLENTINIYLNMEGIEGISLGIVKGTSMVYSNGYGLSNRIENTPMSTTTIFPLASISKTITAVAIMKLYEDDYFSLNDNISEYLPFDLYNPYYPNQSISFKMLLTHTASLAHDIDTQQTFYFCSDLPESYSLKQFIKESLVVGEPLFGHSNFLDLKPGSAYSYSNTGFAILGLLVEEISGMKFQDFCQEYIFDPLEMKSTWWFTPLETANNVTQLFDSSSGYIACLYNMKAFPAGNLRSNIPDLAKFLLMFMNYGTLNGTQVLNSTTIALMREVHLQAGWNKFGLAWYYTEIGGNELLGHNGMIIPGLSTLMFFDPEKDIGAIYLVNTDNAHHYEMITRLLSIGQQYF